MTFQPSALIDQLSTGIFTELAERKRAAARAGLDIIDLSIGSPDLPPPAHVRTALAEAVQDPSQYGYTLAGTPGFCQAVAQFYAARYGVMLNPEHEVLQCMGSQDGLAHLALALLNPGDLALIPDPGYPIYEANIRIAGGQVYPLPLREQDGFLPQLETIPAEVAHKAKFMILNYPSNPVTALADAAFFERAVAFARKYDILIVHDFAYSELVFDGRRAPSFLSVPGAREVGIEFNSLSKTFNMAGCRIGYAVGNPQALDALRVLKSHVDYGVFAPIQRAAQVALTSDPAFFAAQVSTYERRRDMLVAGLHRAGWPVAPTPATMFMWARAPEGWTSRAFAYALLEHTGVAVTPGDAFGARGEGYIRIALVQPEERLVEAADRIAAFFAGQT